MESYTAKGRDSKDMGLSVYSSGAVGRAGAHCSAGSSGSASEDHSRFW